MDAALEATDRKRPPSPDAPGYGGVVAEDVWQAPADKLLARLGATAAGLDAAEAQARLATWGPNNAATVKRTPLWLKFLARFRSPLVIILLIASALSASTGDIASFVIVAAIVTLSITLDFVQQVRAESAVEALRKSVAVQASVRRGGAKLSVPIEQLVPGDVVELIAGDLVPADSRLLDCRDLFVNQALLTGEPYPAQKQAGDAASGAENPAAHPTRCSPEPRSSAVQGPPWFAGPAPAPPSATSARASPRSRRPPPSRSASAASACC